MSTYTTGEIAKLCGVTVRTVQYYDSRNILAPSGFSEGGRRLYSEEDLKRLRIICFLRDLGLPINSIAQLLAEEDPGSVISMILDQQEELLSQELAERNTKLDKISQLKRELKQVKHFTVESIGDIAHIMANKKKLRRIHFILLAVGIPLEVIEWATFLYALTSGIWWPFLLGLLAVACGTVLLVCYYYQNVWYICPNCHCVFRPGFWEMFFARHTPSTRRLTCTGCGHKGFCVETCRTEEQ